MQRAERRRGGESYRLTTTSITTLVGIPFLLHSQTAPPTTTTPWTSSASWASRYHNGPCRSAPCSVGPPPLHPGYDPHYPTPPCQAAFENAADGFFQRNPLRTGQNTALSFGGGLLDIVWGRSRPILSHHAHFLCTPTRCEEETALTPR
jgi:hypothetical protein